MSLDTIIKDFLLDKKSYMKCGVDRIKAAIETKYDLGESVKVSDIKRVKRALKKELKFDNAIKSNYDYRKNHNGDVTAKGTITKEDIKKFRIMAQSLGLTFTKTNEDATKESILNKVLEVNDPPVLVNQVGMHIVMGCHHVPFQNKTLHQGVMQLLEDYKSDIKGFHLIGDFLDLNALSSHDRGKFTAVPGLTLDTEYEAGNLILDEYEDVLDKEVWKTYLYGNHEDRYNRWMKDMNNAKTPLQSPKDALDLLNRGYQVQDSWMQDFFTLGKHLDIFHGIYFNVHSAKAHIDKLRGSCMYAHTHRIQTYIEGNTGGFNIGACADFNSKAFNYATRAMKSAWQNGFAVVMIDVDGTYHVTQIICQNGRFYFAGKKY